MDAAKLRSLAESAAWLVAETAGRVVRLQCGTGEMIRSAGAAAVDSNHRPRAAALMAPPPQRAGRGFEWTIEPSGSGGDGEQPFVVFREASSSSAAAVGGGGRRGLLYASESKHGDGSLFLLCKVWFGAEPAPGSELLKKAQWEVQRVPGPGGTSYLRLASAFFDSQASPVPALLVATRGERPLFTWSTASGIPPETPTSPTARSRRRKFDQFANCGPSFHAHGGRLEVFDVWTIVRRW